MGSSPNPLVNSHPTVLLVKSRFVILIAQTIFIDLSGHGQ